MPNMPSIYGGRAYQNQSAPGQASGQITSNLIKEENIGKAVTELGKAIGEMGVTFNKRIAENNMLSDRISIQEAEVSANEAVQLVQRDMMEGKKLDVPIQMSMGSGGFVFEQVMGQLGVDREDDSRRARLMRLATRKILAKNFMNTYNLQNEQLRNSQTEKIYKISENAKKGLNFTNFSERMEGIVSMAKAFNWSAKDKKDFITSKTYAYRSKAMENDINTMSAFVLSQKMSNEQKQSIMLSYKSEMKEKLSRTETAYSGIMDTEKIYNQGEKHIDSIIKRMNTQDTLKDKLVKKNREDFLDDFDLTYSKIYTSEADMVLQNTGIDDRWDERVKQGKEKIISRGGLATEQSDGVDPGGFNFETDMGVLEEDLLIGRTTINEVTGEATIAPSAEKKVKENGVLTPYLQYLNQDAMKNPLIQRVFKNADETQKRELAKRFHVVNVNGKVELRYKSLLDAIVMNGGKSEYLRAFEGDDYTREQKRRDDIIVGRSIASLDSGLYTIKQTRDRLRWRLQNTDLSEVGYNRALNRLKQREQEAKKPEPKLDSSVASDITAFGQTAKGMIKSAVNRAFNSDPSQTMRRKLISSETGAWLPTDSEANYVKSKLEVIVSNRIAVLKTQAKGMGAGAALGMVKKEKIKILSELNNGYITDPATGKQVKIRDIRSSVAKASSDYLTDSEAIELYKDKSVKLDPVLRQSLERRIVDMGYKHMDQIEANNVAEVTRKR